MSAMRNRIGNSFHLAATLAGGAVLLAACQSGGGAEGGHDIRTEVVTYDCGDTQCTGYIAWDANVEGQRPGVLVVHEWWGHNDYARRRAEMLAELGYTAFALDMYGDGRTADHPEDAQQFSSAVMSDMPTAVARFEAARMRLETHPTTDPEKIAAIGYCFGGAVVLRMARRGIDLDGVASFHGSLAGSEPEVPGELEAAILVCHGGSDDFVTEEQVAEFKRAMQEAGADLTFRVYEGAEHSFTNPEADAKAARFGLPLAYDAEADEASWNDLRRFLEGLW